MTIKKIGLSVLAATMITSTAFAGTLTLDSNASSVASELLVDNNASLGSVGIDAVYTPSLQAGVIDGKILVTLEGGSITTLPSGFVYNIDTNKTVGNNPQLAGQNDQKLIFDINDTINDYDRLKLVTLANLDPDQNISMNIDMISDSVTMTIKMLDNVDDDLDTSDAKVLAEAKQEWDVKVGSTIFDALIDAANSFANFTTNGTDSQSSDYALITVTQDTTIENNTTDIDLNVTLLADTNLSEFMDSIELDGTPMTAGGTNAAGQYVFTGDIADITTAGDYNITLDSNGSTEIEKTNFEISVSSDNTAKNANFAKTYLTEAAFGEWGIYGYNAQIPNVRNKSTLHTYINITNSSSIAADAVFTIFPKVGTTNASEADTCTYNAGSIAKNTQMKYDFADIIANSDCSAAVKSSVNFSVELAVPTKPDDVYVNAYTKNDDLEDFIVLPVYNTSDMSY